LSLIMVKKEIIRVAEYIQGMLLETKAAFRSKDFKVIENIQDMDSKVDILHQSIIPFLAKLSQEELTEVESQECMNYMYIQNELESIGDIVDKNIMALASKKIDQNLIFSEEGFHELEHLLYKLNKNYKKLFNALLNDDKVVAKKISKNYKNREEEKYKRLHIERLHKGLEESLATSSVHLDLISYFTRINGQIAYIAERILWIKE